MNKLNQINCVTGYKNVGFGTCIFDPKQIGGMLLFPEARTFTADEVASMQATLTAAAKHDSKSSRMYPIHRFVATTDNTEDAVIQTFEGGAKQIVRDGDYDLMFQYLDGALCLHTALRTFNGATPFLLYDKRNNLIGSTSNGLLSTIAPHFFYAKPWGMATGSTTAAYLIRVSFTPDQINEYLGFVPCDFDITDIKGLRDVEVVINSYNEGTGVANVSLVTLCNKVNLASSLATELTDADNYVATNAETGEEIDITDVAYTAGNKTFDITLDTGDSDYPDAGGKILVNFRAPSVLLSVNGITGYEGVEATIELAAS